VNNINLHIHPPQGFRLGTLEKNPESRQGGSEDKIFCRDCRRQSFKKVGATITRDPRPEQVFCLPRKWTVRTGPHLKEVQGLALFISALEQIYCFFTKKSGFKSVQMLKPEEEEKKRAPGLHTLDFGGPVFARV